MSDPKRYSRQDIYDVTYQAPDNVSLPEPSDDGEFVRWEDYARLKAERKWRPIETAPDKDRIIICAFNGEIEIIYSSDLCYYPESQYPRCWMPLPKPPTN